MMMRSALTRPMLVRRWSPSVSLRYFSAEFHLDKNTYHRLTDHLLETLSENLEEIEDLGVDGFDCYYGDGVLTLNLGEKGSYVINKQAPNLQIWSSSPINGPKRYNFDPNKKRWTNTRDGHDLLQQLQAELKELLDSEVEVERGIADFDYS